MATGGQVLVPTLGGYYWMAGINEAIDPADATPDPFMLPRLVELANYNLAEGTESMRAARAAGVRIGLGSDRGGVSGEDAALELVRMIHHGLPVADALLAATSVGAVAIGLEDQIGTVQPGRLADLVLVDGDVLAEPEVLLDRSRIWAVLQLGELVAGAALENDQRSDIRS
jgi:imidazolonepropionase-like amidohydrolase